MDSAEIRKKILCFEVNKFDDILSLCQSPLEIKFVSNLYWFFVKSGFSISLETIRPDDEEGWNDDKLLKLWKLIKKGEAANYTKTINDPLIECSTILCGFNIRCLDVIYRIFPQFPVYDETEIRYADLLIEMRSFEWKHLANFVIECDGFAFHNTREQLINDNNRTRFLIKHGYTTIRYQGMEINNMDDRFLLNLENTMHHYVFNKESHLFSMKTY